MKVTKHFYLPDDRQELETSNKAMDMYCALWDFSQELRTAYKHNPNDYTENQLEVVDNLRQLFYTALEDHGVNLDTLSN